MMMNEKLDVDKISLYVKNHSDLLKNYAALRTTSNFTKCKIASKSKCEIINPSEVSRALNNYAEKMSTIAKIRDEKLLKICQEIKKLNRTAQMKKYDELGTSSRTSDSSASFEEDLIQNKTINASFTEEKLTQLSSNLQKDLSNCDVTVDDFLTMSNENHLQNTEKENISMQGDEAMQNDFPILQHTPEGHPEFLEKSRKEIQEIKDSLIHYDQRVTDPLPSTERPYFCSKCQKTFKRNLHLKRHFTVAHTQSKNFKCDVCDKLFSRKDYLDKHIAGHQKKDLKIKLLEQGIVVRTKIFSKSDK